MDQGFKHFSHLHNLIMHQIPKGIEVSCSGCHSSAIGTIYVCWQCNFFLHDQCYRATRSLNHPSHPPHPLTLVPYPTYHSNSFYCSSCEIIGTGFSYSCAECEFDLHVQCAYSISQATSFKNAHQFQELVPQGRNEVQNSSIDHHVPYASIPVDYPQNPISYAQEPLTSQNRTYVSIPTRSLNYSAQYSSAAQTGPSVSIPIDYPHNPIPSAQDPPMTQNPPVSIPTSSCNSSAQYTSLEHSGPSISFPTEYAQNPIPSDQDSSMSQNRVSVSIPTGSHNSSAQYPSVEQCGPSMPIPTEYRQNPVPYAQDPSTPQNKPSVYIPVTSQNSSVVLQTGPSVSIPTNPSDSITSSHDPSKPQNGLQDKEVMHFSHPHKLSRVNLQKDEVEEEDDDEEEEEDKDEEDEEEDDDEDEEEDKDEEEEEENEEDDEEEEDKDEDEDDDEEEDEEENEEDDEEEENEEDDEEEENEEDKDDDEEEKHEDEEEENEVTCSGCKETLVGNGYSCVEPDCDFHLHESCFHLKKEIHHKSHQEHPLTLLPLAPYGNKDGEYTCNACFSDGTGFTYHCSICAFDLHITCVSLPETVKRDDHKHTLQLYYSCPVKDEDIYCDVCHGEIQKDHWVYYCEQCDYGTHLGCVDCEEYERNSIVDPQAQLQMLQFQMEMARRNAQFVASLGSSLASLVG